MYGEQVNVGDQVMVMMYYDAQTETLQPITCSVNTTNSDQQQNCLG
jgi:aspartate 1-decarboxylase